MALNIYATYATCKTDLFFRKWNDEFNKFLPQHVVESKNWDFDEDLLFKVENVWA